MAALALTKYNGDFTDRRAVAREFDQGGPRYSDDFMIGEGFPTDDEIIFANYESGGYEGWAFVLYERDGILYEVHGSHCSCFGLEGQWEPEPTTWEAIAIRKPSGYDGLTDALIAEANRRLKP